jgi:hypothetical protein
LTNFPNGKQTQESLESNFSESEFRETNMAWVAQDFSYLRNHNKGYTCTGKLVFKYIFLLFCMQRIFFLL